MPVNKDKKTGKWYARLNYIDSLGNYKQVQSKRFDTKHEAEDELAKMKIDHKKVKNALTFNDVFDEYVEDQKNKVKPITHSHYKPLYEHIKPFIGELQIEKLTIPKYKQIKKQLDDTELSTSRKNRLHKFVCALLKTAYVNHGIYNDVPSRVGGFSDPGKIEEDVKFFTEEQFQSFRDQFKDDILFYSLFGVLFYEGLRIGEALALDWKSVDLDNGYIKINKTYTSKINKSYKTQNYYITSPKTKASNRTIPIEKSLLNDLKMLYIWYQDFEHFNNTWFVFGGYRPMSETRIANKKNEACKNAELDTITIHQFRHSCISYLANNGVDPVAIQNFVGHSKLSTTMDIYTHVYQSKMDNIFAFKK